MAEDAAERNNVRDWQAEQFERLGFDEWTAELLADHGVDYHKVEDLIRDGCPPELAAEIVG